MTAKLQFTLDLDVRTVIFLRNENDLTVPIDEEVSKLQNMCVSV